MRLDGLRASVTALSDIRSWLQVSHRAAGVEDPHHVSDSQIASPDGILQIGDQNGVPAGISKTCHFARHIGGRACSHATRSS